jgi:hypothetical protein
LINFGYVYPTPLDVLPPEIKNFLDDYRNIKSRRFVTTGHRLVDYYSPETDEINKKYFHEMYFGIGEGGDEVIYILSNEYSVLSVDFVENEEMEYRDGSYKLIKTTKEDCYSIRTEEKIIGAIHNGNINYSISVTYAKKIATFKNLYHIYITDSGPKVEADYGYIEFYILEHDVPILMENIKELDIVKAYKPDREKDKKADYVVEWWYK